MSLRDGRGTVCLCLLARSQNKVRMVGGDIYNATPKDVAGQWASRIAITVVVAGAAIYI
jgi:hypothetical protein